ncbi:unnamed protein product, partial [Mesorhabditis belari]|uniref:Uncharacterized protein n=1 Tax=Mesorhabditis belari TaxID=2138241 RepID=A0AAF3JBD8_9BILA
MFQDAILDSAKRRSGVDQRVLELLRSSLENFKEPEESQLVDVAELEPRHHPDPNIERYFHCVTIYGKPCLEWELVRPAFLWKLKHVLREMIRVDHTFCEQENQQLKEKEENEEEANKTETDGVKREAQTKKILPKIKADFDDEKGELRVLHDLIVDTAAKMEGFPFTFQRLCELLEEPSRLYRRAEKFYRAVDKCINVVTTITSEGDRITGIEEWSLGQEDTTKIEQRFYGKVDELDDENWEPTTKAPVEEKPLDMSKKETLVERKQAGDDNTENGMDTSTSQNDDAPSEKKLKTEEKSDQIVETKTETEEMEEA